MAKARRVVVHKTVELDLAFTCLVTPGSPGRMSGPPEHCYPPEPADAEIACVAVNIPPFLPVYLPSVMLPVEVLEYVHEQAIEAAAEDERGAELDHAEAESEKRRGR